jgi:hypothetical protein
LTRGWQIEGIDALLRPREMPTNCKVGDTVIEVNQDVGS